MTPRSTHKRRAAPWSGSRHTPKERVTPGCGCEGRERRGDGVLQLTTAHHQMVVAQLPHNGICPFRTI